MIQLHGRSVLWLALLCVCGISIFATAQAPIQVYIDATGKHDAPVTPEASTLAASIDGKPVQVLSAQPAKDDKLLFAVMLDISESGVAQQKAMKESVVKLFQALTGEHSLGYLVLFNVQSYASKRPVLPFEVQTILDHAEFTGGTSLYDCVKQVATGTLSKSTNPDTPRRLIIVLSDGKDNYSKMSLDEMEKSVQREGVTVFMLAQISGQEAPKAEYTVESITLSSGGKTIKDETMHDGLQALINAVESQIKLTIVSPQSRDGQLHTLSIKTIEKGVTIAAPAAIAIP